MGWDMDERLRRPSGIRSLTIGDTTLSYVPDGAVQLSPRAWLPGTTDEVWAKHPEYLDESGNLVAGIGGLLVERGGVRPGWALAVLITGLGALFAILWELGEWYTFIRHGTELDTAYEDTLGDMTLGSLGAFLAALLVARVASRR